MKLVELQGTSEDDPRLHTRSARLRRFNVAVADLQVALVRLVLVALGREGLRP